LHRGLRILFCSAEVDPFAKVGGLADVAGSLPKALKAMGHDVRIAMPAYPIILQDGRFHLKKIVDSFEVSIGGRPEGGFACESELDPGIPVYFIGHPSLFASATRSTRIYSPPLEACVLFCKGVFELAERIAPDFVPDIIHSNDWHTALVPVYLSCDEALRTRFATTKSVFTIHNLAYQGEFDPDALRIAELPESLYNYTQLEAYGRVNLLKGGIVFADRVNTVSRRYAEEIQTPEFGCRLEGLLKYTAEQGKLSGICNGIDYDLYDPARDPRIASNYTPGDPSGKRECKTALQEEMGLRQDQSAMLLGIISRMADQKGFDLIWEAADALLEDNVQLVVLGSGERRYEDFFSSLSRRKPGRVAARTGVHLELAHRIYSGSDAFVMPSRFEPCGLGQLIALRYGTIPIVRTTGGLADTITEFEPPEGEGNGFTFGPYDVGSLLAAVKKAVSVFRDEPAWRRVMDNASRCDFSWTSSASEYEKMYRRTLGCPEGVRAA
jgi:starch synthase